MNMSWTININEWRDTIRLVRFGIDDEASNRWKGRNQNNRQDNAMVIVRWDIIVVIGNQKGKLNGLSSILQENVSSVILVQMREMRQKQINISRR
jgi:hypothetical protein